MHDETLRAMIEAPLLELARAREFAVSTVEIPPARPASDFCPECGGSMRDWPARLPNGVRCANGWHDGARRGQLGRVIALEESPEFVQAFSSVVAESAGKVCQTCGLERMGHAPESQWLGFDPHAWEGVETDASGIARARELTNRAYSLRNSR